MGRFGEKGKFMVVGRKVRALKRTTKLLCAYTRRKFEDPEPEWKLIWLQLLRIRNASTNRLTTKEGPRRICILFLDEEGKGKREG